MRWIFHLVRTEELTWGSDGRYAPPSLAREGFIHASYQSAVRGSADLYFDANERDELTVLAIDPRRLDVPLEVAATPRGPMPHILGSIPIDAVRVLDLASFEEVGDAVTGTRIALVAFDRMTLLDLVGPLDALARIATMGFDPTTTCEVIAMTRTAWSACSATLTAARYRPPLDTFDVLVVPGGPGTRTLERDPDAIAWLASFPPNRLTTSVCTGSLLLGAAGRLDGKRATTHRTMMTELAQFGATPVTERVVDEGQLVTAGGVTCGIELGLHLVGRLAGSNARLKIATQMGISV